MALKTMRLGFQNIGPHITNLEMFAQVETLVLTGNKIEEITRNAFQTNLKLQFLSLGRNMISEVCNLNHLNELQLLDLSNNLIVEVEDLNQLPNNLLSLKFIGNPIEQEAKESRELASYRKPFVMHLQQLEDLDKIEIVPAERMSY